ncbi:MAG: hypothetical protein RL113_108 [Pseudomonadota bacterium]
MKKLLVILSFTMLYASNTEVPYTLQNVEEVSAVDSELLPLEQTLLPSKEEPSTLENRSETSVSQDKTKEKESMITPSSETESMQNQEQKIQKIRESLHIAEPSAREKKIDAIRKELHIDYQVPKSESRLDKGVANIKEKFEAIDLQSSISKVKDMVGLGEEKKKEEGFSISDSLQSIGLDIELPSLWGSKPKKKDHSLFGIGFLGDIKDTGTSFYKGAKYSGQSAEMMSGMVYKSSKMYNTIFGMFDDSPLNIFEEEEEPSLFDVFEHGNSILDMFD